jgi:ketosteroid isomerase-like protein
MDAEWLDRYIAAWVRHARAGGGDYQALAQLLGFMRPDVVYEDVPTGAVYVGHEGVAAMCAQAHSLSTDMVFEPQGAALGDGFFGFETVTRGTSTGAIGTAAPSGRAFTIRAASVGRLADSLVTEHRDYWDLSALLAQLGAS